LPSRVLTYWEQPHSPLLAETGRPICQIPPKRACGLFSAPGCVYDARQSRRQGMAAGPVRQAIRQGIDARAR
jgi:hypothetical protein